MTPIIKTDGKRKITIKKARYEDAYEIGFCRNGYQTLVATADKEMITWLIDALSQINAEIAEQNDSAD